jgi:hypothetical protein
MLLPCFPPGSMRSRSHRHSLLRPSREQRDKEGKDRDEERMQEEQGNMWSAEKL